MNATTETAAGVKPAFEEILVTPALAAEWLLANRQNRRLRNDRVRSFAEEMLAGRWQLVTDAIGFDTRGRLVNGQHRLSAIVESGVTVPLIVARGLAPAAAKNIDMGLKHTVGDSLTHHFGVERGDKVAAICSIIYAMETGNICGRHIVDRVAESYALHRASVDWVLCQREPANRTFVTGSGILAAVVLWHEQFPDEADQFLVTFWSRNNFHDGHPAKVLFEWGMNVASDTSNQTAVFYRTCQCVHAAVEGRDITGRFVTSKSGWKYLQDVRHAEGGK